MNFYKHHIGDYAQATAHLSFVEDAAYSRMLRKYYAEEKPLPADLKAVQRLVGARTREEKEAVDQILGEFFVLEADGWHNRRADAELASNRDLDEDREAKAANERERQRRHREERKHLFDELRKHDIVPPWDARTETLRKLLSDANATRDTVDKSQPVTPPVTRTATANQTPDARHQTPDTKEEEIPSKLTLAPALPPEDRPDAGDLQGSLVDPPPAMPKGPPDCPHLAVLALWAEVLPAMPQHLPSQWRGTRADHLRARWRETAAEKGWTTEAQGLAYLRKFFGYVGQSTFLTGRASPQQGKRPFFIELEWLVNPTNWAKVHEGKYHSEAAA